MDQPSLGKVLIIIGSLIALVGVLFVFSDKWPILKSLGRLPGDIHIEKPGMNFYFPVTTSILLSVLLTFVMWLFSKR